MNEHSRQLIARVRALPVTRDPPGWVASAPIAVGGLVAVGFAEDDRTLLLVSSSGRGIVDCRTNERLARDYDSSMAWYRELALEVEGIGSAAGQSIPVCGVHGGGLHRATPDGWTLEAAWPDWPDGDVILCAPSAVLGIESREPGCCKIARTESIVACGFSRNGNVIVVAESHTVQIWNRSRTNQK